MANRWWNHQKTLQDGQTARTDPINAHLNAIAAGFDAAAAEMNRSFRFTGDTAPTEQAFQFPQTAAQRANLIIGFDSQGTPQLRSGSFTWRNNWVGAALYSVNDMVRGPAANYFSLYACVTQHTSGVFTDDLAAGRWQIAVDLTEMNRFIRRWQKIAAAHPAVAGDDLFVDVSAGAVVITLPATPALSDQPITICHHRGNILANNITVAGNGKRIMGLLEDMIVNTTNANFELAFCDDETGWRLTKGT
jgi:hypothetical protein